MRPRLQAVPGVLLYLAALLAPLGGLAAVPRLGLPLAGLALAALSVAALVDVVRGARPRVPFDLAWPALLLPCAAFAAGFQGVPTALRLLLAAPAFLAILHVGARRGLVLRAIHAWVLAAAAAALFDALAEAFPAPGWLPRAVDPVSGAVSFFHPDTAAALAQAVFALLVALALLFAGELPRLRRLVLLPALAALFFRLAQAYPALLAATQVPHLPRGYGEAAVALLLLWLAARVTGRLVVARLEDPPGAHVGLLLALVAGVPAAALLTAPVGLATVTLFALLAAYARPIPRGADRGRRARLVCGGGAVLAACLAGLHLACYAAWTAPANRVRLEARLEALREERSVRDSTADTARCLQAIARHAPGAADFWRAADALADGAPRPAADAFVRAMARPDTVRHVDADRVDAFLDQLRDLCSSVTPAARGVAYERALLARGEKDLALASLKLFATDVPPEGIPAQPLAAALAALLGHDELAPELAAWGGGTLLGALEGLGAAVWRGAPQETVLVLVAEVDARGTTVRGFGPGGAFGGWKSGPTGAAFWRRSGNQAQLVDGAERVVATVVPGDVVFGQREDRRGSVTEVNVPQVHLAAYVP